MNKPKRDRPKDYIAELGISFKNDVAVYIERCHLEDGGYFFARVLPSSGMDTYFAIKSLAILGVKPEREPETVGFFMKNIVNARTEGIAGIFAAVGVLKELGGLTDEVKNYSSLRIRAFQNRTGGFGAYENIDVEVTSELQETYQAVSILNTVGAKPDEEKVSRFVSGLLNADGGYGRDGHSTGASTFYATAIQKLIGVDRGKPGITRDYLRRREENWQVNFLEELYWLVGSLANIGEKPKYPDKISGFVSECLRANGGFTRFTEMGITTLEYTYYALEVMKNTGII